MASKWGLVAFICVQLPSQAASHVFFDDAAQVITASVSRGDHIAWNMGCWLLALSLMIGARRREPLPANELGLRSAGVARLASGDR